MDAAAAAQSKGLPTGWTASRNKGGRWTYVAPDGEEFSSLASAKTAAANNKKPPRVSESPTARPLPTTTTKPAQTPIPLKNARTMELKFHLRTR